ncbi:MAG: hypothetical protein H6841_06225 [Planctomycetes bacterium]|nr:hypothetical protein [Planctomycetota bacterium]
MAEANSTAKDYSPGQTELVRRTLLTVATVLGDQMAENVVIVGGLVPSLLLEDLPKDIEPHVGTGDLDLALSVVVFDEDQYKSVSKRLREHDFHPADDPETLKPIPWKWKRDGKKIEIDFLIEYSRPPQLKKAIREIADQPEVRFFGDGFGALIMEGMDLAVADCVTRRIKGTTLDETVADRDIKVAGLAAYFVLKALAHNKRKTLKDPYDLWYVIKNYSADLSDVAAYLLRHKGHASMGRAVEIVRREFTAIEMEGPVRVARFLDRAGDDELRRDVVSVFTRLLELMS